MNKVLLTIFISLTSLVPRAQFVIWDDPIEVSLDEQDNNRPRIELDAQGEPVIMWGNDQNSQIYIARSVDGAFQSPQALLPEGVECFTSDWAGPEFAGAEGRLAVVFKRQPENLQGAYLLLSEDGGMTWGDTIRIDGLEAPDMQSRFPSVALSGDSQIHITFMEFEGNYIDPAYVYRRSDDNGLTWTDITNASTELFPGEACDCCMAELITTNDHVAVLYRNNDENIREVKVGLSSDGGETFDLGLSPDNTLTYSNVCFSSGPVAIAEDEQVSMVYKITSGSDSYVRLTTFDLPSGEVSFDQELHLADWASNRQNNPRIARQGETYFAVWEASEGLATECMFACSVNGEEGLVNTADTLNVEIPGKQINPDVILDGTTVHTVWQDRGNGKVMYRKGMIDPLGTSVQEELVREITVFPNPCVDLLRVTGLSSSELFITDISGRALTLEVTDVIGGVSINVSELPRGSYILHFKNGRNQTFIKS